MKKGDAPVGSALNSLFRVQERFCRSINLQLDWASRSQLDGYVVSEIGRTLAERIAASTRTQRQPRSWSITGPYGCGKSAFALFLADLLSSSAPNHPEGRHLREKAGLKNHRLFPLLLVGERAPLASSLLAGIAKSIAPLSRPLAQEALRASRHAHAEQRLRPILKQAASVATKKGYDGLLFVVDEFGKFLEYASLHPDETDFFVLQELAEYADRKTDSPLVLVTILHTAFSEYVNRLETTRRSEWQKVQGRFVDVVFQEPAEQFLQLIGSAVQRTRITDAVVSAERSVSQMIGATAFDEARRRLPLQTLLPKCLPLHPAVSLLLWPVFRGKLAQNERSLFAFLGAREPLGFQDFLSEPVDGALPLYGLDRLYDYVVHTLRDAAFRGDRARRWAEVDNALNRIPGDAPAQCHSAIKTIGLITLYGQAVGLRATADTIVSCLGSPSETRASLDYLKGKSILVFRKHDQTYALWEGSDIDLDAAAERAMSHIGTGSLATRIRETVTLHPIVARSHYIRTGTLRYFSVGVIDGSPENIGRALNDQIPSDGSISYVLSSNEGERKRLIEAAKQLNKKATGHLRVLAFPRPIVGLEPVLREVELWAWIQNNEPKLQGDAVARQEVRARYIPALAELQTLLGRTFNLSGHAFDPKQCDWVYGGHVHPDRTGREFLHWLSEICTTVFRSAPTFKNELLNREHLSSAAAAARRNLLERLLSKNEAANLGLTGFPPEYSMYMSMLREGGFHIERNDAWQVSPPRGEWVPAWKAIEEFLDGTRHERRPVVQLFAALKAPPFGIKDGPLPLMLCCVLLIKKGSIALYENGVFIPDLRIDILERVLRAPDQFEIQEHTVGSGRRDLLDALGQLLGTLAISTERNSRPNIVQIVKPLIVATLRLPAYVRQTKRLPDQAALGVRDLLLSTRDPYALVFKDLPRVLAVSAEDSKAYVARISAAIIVLQHAYAQLLDEVETSIRTAFSLSGTAPAVRQQLRLRALPLVGKTVDPTLTLLIRELSNLGERDWREVIATAVNRGLPPAQWQDSDVASFQLRLNQFSRDILRLEELVGEHSKSGAAEIIRVGILNGHLTESRAIISVDREEAKEVVALTSRLQEVAADVGRRTNGRRVVLAALARAVSQMLGEMEKDSKSEIGV